MRAAKTVKRFLKNYWSHLMVGVLATTYVFQQTLDPSEEHQFSATIDRKNVVNIALFNAAVAILIPRLLVSLRDLVGYCRQKYCPQKAKPVKLSAIDVAELGYTFGIKRSAVQSSATEITPLAEVVSGMPVAESGYSIEMVQSGLTRSIDKEIIRFNERRGTELTRGDRYLKLLLEDSKKADILDAMARSGHIDLPITESGIQSLRDHYQGFCDKLMEWIRDNLFLMVCTMATLAIVLGEELKINDEDSRFSNTFPLKAHQALKGAAAVFEAAYAIAAIFLLRTLRNAFRLFLLEKRCVRTVTIDTAQGYTVEFIHEAQTVPFNIKDKTIVLRQCKGGVGINAYTSDDCTIGTPVHVPSSFLSAFPIGEQIGRPVIVKGEQATNIAEQIYRSNRLRKLQAIDAKLNPKASRDEEIGEEVQHPTYTARAVVVSRADRCCFFGHTIRSMEVRPGFVAPVLPEIEAHHVGLVDGILNGRPEERAAFPGLFGGGNPTTDNPYHQAGHAPPLGGRAGGFNIKPGHPRK